VAKFSGTLRRNGTAWLNPDNYLLLEGSPGDDPRQAAAIARDDIAQQGFENGDPVVVTGSATQVGQRPAIWMQSISAAAGAPAASADLARVRGMRPANRAAKKATAKKKVAKAATKKTAKKAAPKNKPAKRASKQPAQRPRKKAAKTKRTKGGRK